MNILDIGRMTDGQARDYLETIRWPEGPVCPHCGSKEVTRLQGEAHRHGCIQCNACREQFTVTVGSVMESSHIPLVKWVMAFHLICSSKKGFSALQLQRELELGSYRTAWFMAHRIRHAMNGEEMKKQLDGVVEVDESYVGGRPRQHGSKRGRGTAKKPIIALVQRDGDIRCKPLERVNGECLMKEIVEHVAPTATIVTDELASYRGVGDKFDGGHKTIKHSTGQYVRKSKNGGIVVHTNTVESFFALIKRGHFGVYHQMSKQHLHRYCSEFSFRWRHRKVKDSVRTVAAIVGSAGKRLMYETPA